MRGDNGLFGQGSYSLRASLGARIDEGEGGSGMITGTAFQTSCFET